MRQTPGGGYIVAGGTDSMGASGMDAYLVKTGARDNELWSRTFGGPRDDAAYSVQQTPDGGYIIAGYTGSLGAGGTDAYLVKTDARGSELWSRTFGGPRDDAAYSVQQTTDGGFIVAGDTSSSGTGGTDAYLVKTDARGSELWSRTFGGPRDDAAYSVQQTPDGGYIIAGYTGSLGAGGTDAYLVKTDARGSELWSRTFGGPRDDAAYSVQQTPDGGYIIAGETGSLSTEGTDAYLIRTDARGAVLWSHTFSD